MGRKDKEWRSRWSLLITIAFRQRAVSGLGIGFPLESTRRDKLLFWSQQAAFFGACLLAASLWHHALQSFVFVSFIYPAIHRHRGKSRRQV
jgi:hypothetical protein